jgi:hypothetical protein
MERRRLFGSLFLLIIVSAAFSQEAAGNGDALLEATENCGVLSGNNQWFSLALVKLFADSVINVGKENQDAEFIFEHHNGKRTKVVYSGQTKKFVVLRNYVPPPKKEKVIDPVTRKVITVEWE